MDTPAGCFRTHCDCNLSLFSSGFGEVAALTRTPADPEKLGRNHSRSGEAAGFRICSKLGSKIALKWVPKLLKHGFQNGSKIASLASGRSLGSLGRGGAQDRCLNDLWVDLGPV